MDINGGGNIFKKKIEKENSILIEKGNRMLADVVFLWE